jgi:hypothetical protein
MISTTMRPLRRCALATMLFLLAACDVFHGVVRQTEVETFDAAMAQELVRGHVDFDPRAGHAWDGETMWCVVQRGEIRAGVGFTAPRSLSVELLWVGRPPEARDLRASLELQSQLIEMLRERFSAVPPESAWSVRWVRMEDPLLTATNAESRRTDKASSGTGALR